MYGKKYDIIQADSPVLNAGTIISANEMERYLIKSSGGEIISKETEIIFCPFE